MAHQVVSDYTKVSENANVKVFVRARPPEAHDEPAEELFELGQPERGGRVKKLSMKQWRRARNEDGDHEQWGGVGGNAFQFDGVFWCDEKQTTVFETVCREQVDHILKGYNACCFAYGQTGSGKTHTMFFPRGGQDRSNQTMHGLIPRAVDYLFACLRTAAVDAEVTVSFLEIYCDTLRDLGKASLSHVKRQSMSHGPSTEKTSVIYQGAAKQREETFGLGMRASASGGSIALPVATMTDDTANLEKSKGHWYELKEEIREDKDGTVFVKGLAKLPVQNSAEVLQIIDRGLCLRATESTNMNDTSSRSHTVFTIEVASKQIKADHGLAGKLHLVDLAGSERLKKSESSGIRMEEALHINKSLTALGKVIVSLDPAQTNAHVPYRDSKLTRLLQNALGGDSYTSVLATIRPTRSHAEECLSTLQFANRCRKVANNPRVHRIGETDAQSSKAKDELIARLRIEIERLKEYAHKIKQRLAQVAGLNIEEMASSELGGADRDIPNGRGYDPAQTQAAVSQAVLAALRAAGIMGAEIDDLTGGVRLSNGRLLEGTLPGAFLGHYHEAKERRKSRYTSLPKRSNVHTMAARIAKAMGYTSVQDVPQTLLNVLVEREDEFQALKRKFESAQDEARGLHKELELGKRQIMSAALGVQRTESASKNNVISVTKQMEEQLCAQEEKHAQQLRALVQENNLIIEELIQTKQAVYDKEDKQPHPHTKMRHLTIRDISRKIAAAYDAAQRAEGRATGSEASIANLKDQYEYWLNRKNQDVARFISQLNIYRLKKNAQLEMADRELITLWDAVEHHARVLHRVRQGKYALKQLRSNVAAPAIPASDFPSILEHLTLNKLPATLRAKLKGEHKHAEEIQSRESQLDVDYYYAGVPRSSPRSKSNGLPQRDTAGVTMRGPQTGSFVDSANNKSDVAELKEELMQTKLKLHHYETCVDRAVKDRTKAELSAHATVQYMRDLEISKQAARAKASEHAQRYAQLRVAYEAQTRKLALLRS